MLVVVLVVVVRKERRDTHIFRSRWRSGKISRICSCSSLRIVMEKDLWRIKIILPGLFVFRFYVDQIVFWGEGVRKKKRALLRAETRKDDTKRFSTCFLVSCLCNVCGIG